MNDPEFDPYLPPRAPIGLSIKGKATVGLDGNPWLTIWTSPRATIRGIVDTDPTRNVLLLAVITGFNAVIGNTIQYQLGIITALLTSLFGGALYGIAVLYLNGLLLSITGRWLGGIATSEQIRASQAWASVPVVPLAVGGLAMLLIPGALGPILLLYGVASIVLAIWCFVLCINTLAEVQQFSGWSAFGSMFLAGLLVFGIVMVVAVVGMVGLAVLTNAGR
jgi:hypothetical protein